MTEILVVDDEPLVLLTLKAMCDWSSFGIHIAADAGNGRAALEYLQKNPGVDIVITDVDMPVMDGLELSEKMRESGFMQDVIFLSSYSNFEYVRRAFKAGACDYILKSEMDEKKIVDLVRKIVGRAPESGGRRAGDRRFAGEGAAPDQADFEDPAVFESRRSALLSEIAERGAATDGSGVPLIDKRFAECAFTVAPPFFFMIMRPGDMSVVRKRYENNLYAFQKTVTDLLSHFVSADGDSGALSFDQYYVFMRDRDAMDKTFDKFYEASWSYLDTGFERRTGKEVRSLGEFCAEFAKCLRGFVPPSRIVVRTRRYIREHYGDPELDLAEIAEYTEVSKNHLSWEFARETGETVSDFIARTRIDAAKKLLLETNLRTYEISDKTGYANVETFCRAFKKITGTSPRRFS
jgi:two-component system response regulator YesN